MWVYVERQLHTGVHGMYGFTYWSARGQYRQAVSSVAAGRTVLLQVVMDSWVEQWTVHYAETYEQAYCEKFLPKADFPPRKPTTRRLYLRVVQSEASLPVGAVRDERWDWVLNVELDLERVWMTRRSE